MSKEHVNQHTLISEIAKERDDVTRRQVAEIYESLINKVEKYLDNGTDVEFTRFAKFELVDRNAKTARNPQTGGTVEVPAKRVVKVRLRKRLHELAKEI
jgi:prophage muMc02, DNA-binding protein HU